MQTITGILPRRDVARLVALLTEALAEFPDGPEVEITDGLIRVNGQSAATIRTD